MNQMTRLKLAKSAKKQARHRYECVCGRICQGNGGWSSHKHACPVWRKALMDGTALVESTRDDYLRSELRAGRETP